MKRLNSICLALACTWLAGVAMAAGGGTQEVAVNIEAQRMDQALNALAQQTGLQVLFRAEKAVEGMTAPRVVGKYTAEQALEKLLAGTTLAFEFVNERTVSIQTRDSAGAATERSSGLRLAQDEKGAAGASSSEKSATGSNSGSASKLEEVVVTAQRRKEPLQEVPISISVVSGRDLDKSNYLSVNDALNVLVPGVTTSISSFPGTTQLSVRGVAAPGMVTMGSSPVAYYIDSVPFGFVRSAMVPDVGSFDLQQVEVLRGPQGTLYGANAVNGVVRVLTNDADLNHVEFKARTLVSSMDEGGTGYRGDVAVNVPIIADKLAARLTGSYAYSAGWIDNLVKRDTNDSQLSDVRLKVNAQPSDTLSLGLTWWHSNTDIGAFNLARDDDVYPGIVDAPTTIRFDALGLKIGYQLPGFSVSSATSYIDYKNHNNYDITPFGTAFEIPEWVGQLGFNKDDSTVFAQEITLTSETSGPWRWTAGAFYRDAEDHYYSTGPVLYFPEYPAAQDYGDISRSFAAFGELTRKFLDGRFELTGGLRYFRDQVTVANVEVPNIDPAEHDVDTFHHVSPRVVLNWHPSSDMTGYVSYSEGFRGGFGQDVYTKNLAPNLPPAKPDNLHNYEAGLKGALLGGRITYDSAVYYMDWQDVQQQLVVPACQAVSGTACGFAAVAIVNGPSASGPGIDLNLMARPVAHLHGLEWGINAGWNDLTFDENVVSAGSVLFKKGSRLAASPEYTLGGLAAYSFGWGGSGLQSRFSVSGSYHVKQITRGINGVTSKGDDLLMVHAGFSLVAPEHWTAELFADNATNARGNIVDGGQFFNARIRPRTVGLQVEYRFRK